MTKAERIIILGHSGFIGSHLECMLVNDRNREVVGCSLPDVDLTSSSSASQLAPYFTEDSVLILLAAVKRQFGDTLQAFQKNMAIVENVCHLLSEHPVKRVIFMSSAAVYGEEVQNISISEKTSINPTSFYGIAKYSSECLLKKVCADLQTSLVCLRPPLIYGSGDKGQTYGPAKFCSAALRDEPIVLWGDGTELREFIYIDDICYLIDRLIDNDFEDELNVVSGTSYCFADIIDFLKVRFPNLKISSRSRTKQKVDNAFDARRIKSLFASSLVFTSLEEGLSKTLAQMQLNPLIDVSQLQHLDSSGELLLDLGTQPISNRFLPADGSTEAPRFPLELRLCPNSGLVHLGRPFPVEELMPRYSWLTCFEPEDHLDALVETIVTLPGISQEAVFGGYSFKDDSTLHRLKACGHSRIWRIDPVQDLGVTDPYANVETYQSVLTSDIAEQIRKKYGASDVFIARHVIEHAHNLPQFVHAIKLLVKSGGYIIWELPDCARAMSLGDCTTIWEEHIFYFTSVTFRHLLNAFNFNVIHYESIPYPLENSIIAVVQEDSDKLLFEPMGVNNVATEIARARHFADSIVHRRLDIRHKLKSICSQYGRVVLFGAGHLAVAFISLMEVADLIDCVIDDNPHKKGMRMPVSNLPIVGSEVLYEESVQLCLLSLNPQNQPKVMARHQKFLNRGGVFASIFPGNDLSLENL